VQHILALSMFASDTPTACPIWPTFAAPWQTHAALALCAT
jgi:hypothetical protein